MIRRKFKVNIVVNDRKYFEVIIDPHYEQKHSDHINDELILRLVLRLDRRSELPVDMDNEFSYFLTRIELDQKRYRLIWLLEKDTDYIGVINAFRDRKGV